MITVKKDALKIKTSDGMQSAGVLCQVAPLDNYINFPSNCHIAQTGLFSGVDLGGVERLTIKMPLLTTGISGYPSGVTAEVFPLENFMYNAKGLKKVKFIGNYEKRKCKVHFAFSGTDLEEIDFSEFPILVSGSGYLFFHKSIKIKRIIGEIDMSDCTNCANSFSSMNALEDVTLKKESIKNNINFTDSQLLSDASIQSIINGLAPVETSCTLQLHKDVKAKLTEEQIATITSKNWTLA